MPFLERRLIWALLFISSLIGGLYALVTPLFEASDELWHYPMVKTLADGNGLPVQDPQRPGAWRQEGSQPPLYYALMAAATFWIDTSDMPQVRWLNPHSDSGVVTLDGNTNLVIHPPNEWRQWHGTVLAVRLIRWLSVMLGALTVYFTYRFALELLPNRWPLALVTAAWVAFTPMFVFISASVNNDNLAICLSTAALWWLARWVRQLPDPARITPGPAVVLGCVLGAAALSKQSALGLLGLAGLALLFIHSRSGRLTWQAFRAFSIHGLIIFGLAFLIAFWWYWRNWQLYGDWLGWNRFIAIVGPRGQPATLAQLWGEREGFLQAYWGLFGGVSLPMPAWVYLVLNGSVGLGLIGVGLVLVRAWFRRTLTITQVALWSLPVLWLVIISVSLARWTSLTLASQGRLIFPAISALSLLMVVGLAHLGEILQPRARSLSLAPLFPASSVIFMALLTLLVPFGVIAPNYTPPAQLTPVSLSAIQHPLEVDFGGEMQLLGYAWQTTALRPGEKLYLTLYWQSLSAMDRNWSVFVHVVDTDEIIVAQRDRYPGQGLWATTLLQPGQTFADEYVIALPTTAYAPADLSVKVGLYDLQDGARLPTSLGDTVVRLGTAALLAAPVRQNFDNLISLTSYTVNPRVLHPGETFTVTLNWEALAPMDVNYAVSVRVRDPFGNKWAARDAWPLAGAAPTASWHVGQAILNDAYSLTLPAETPPGQHALEVVIYDSTTLRPLRLVTPDGRLTDADTLSLSKIRIGLP